ncbi:hypothetical protein [Paracoccus benzoatiresistens]|uniref:Uncharacterized protein n=1 Tax=Paracoccus benzoatiresistens TaxID=2997341 RepID=A0ABT4J707_9RHOB|nr:hypothetical protein [Paracoccus sp. EF6]MCZ0962851.1 hypothetical protein [Paracoccus sp. EF6]
MSIHRPINDPDRALIDVYLERHPVTVCPSQFRQPARKARRRAAQVEPQAEATTNAPRIRTSDRSDQAGPRVMSIQAALEWAFLTEKAQIDFDQYGAHEFDRVGLDPLWRGMQMAILGTAVDGGGTSDPAADAQIIASYVETLPIGLGGARMATQVAELARLRSVPDWGQGERLAIVPCGWEPCGWDLEKRAAIFTAATEKTGSIWTWRDERSRKRVKTGEVCPVSYTGTARMIAAKRRNYLDWVGALLHLQASLRGCLHGIELTDALPPMAPWRAGE